MRLSNSDKIVSDIIAKTYSGAFFLGLTKNEDGLCVMQNVDNDQLMQMFLGFIQNTDNLELFENTLLTYFNTTLDTAEMERMQDALTSIQSKAAHGT